MCSLLLGHKSPLINKDLIFYLGFFLSYAGSWWAGLSEEAEPLERPEEVLETVEMVDMRRRVEERM